jgi:hypothetical protein
MSSKSNKESNQEVTKQEEKPIDIRKLALPFSELIEHATPLEVYNGKEKIPFNRRHPEYQVIFRNEFAGELQRFFKNVKKLATLT